MNTTPTTIREWCKAAYENSKAHGFHDDEPSLTPRERIATYLQNITGEVSEAWESFRRGEMFFFCDKAEKMHALGLIPICQLEEELADIVIRVFDTAEAYGIDLQRAIETKHAYNATREHKHGGKRA